MELRSHEILPSTLALKHVTYAPVKFEVATSHCLGDAFTRKKTIFYLDYEEMTATVGLFVWLVLYVRVNSYGHVGMVSSPNHIFFLGKLSTH